ncbi:MAG: hypothetical protein ABI432_11920 [Flavobacteriales bacterium]
MLLGTTADAQPPWIVKWYQEGVLWHNNNGIKIIPNQDWTVVSIQDNGNWALVPHCVGERLLAEIDSLGWIGSCCEGCIEGPSPSAYVGSVYGPTWNRIDIFTSYGIAITGITPEYPWFLGCAPELHEGIASDHHAFQLHGSTLFVGGHDDVCPARIWKVQYSFMPDATNSCWCVPNEPVTLELYGDTLLSVAFPTVTKLDTASGNLGGSFELFTGTPVGNGWTWLSADSLYWISQFGGSDLHLGKYLMGSGPVWEVALPLAGLPVSLHDDGMGRLWTAVGNTIVWINTQDGTYETNTFGLTVDAMDVYNGSIAITGTTDGVTSYIMRAHLTP